MAFSFFSESIDDFVLSGVLAAIHLLVGLVDPFLKGDAVRVFHRADGDGDSHIVAFESERLFFDSLSESL